MVTINYNNENLKLVASRYIDNGALALALISEDTGELYGTVTVNVPGTFPMDPVYDVILDTNNNSAELLQEVINTGLIFWEPYGYTRSGFCTYPIHNLTNAGIEWADEQLG